MNIKDIKIKIHEKWHNLEQRGGKLYQYRTCTDYNLDNLFNGTVTLNRISSFNDFLEGRFGYSLEYIVKTSRYGEILSREIIDEIVEANFTANKEHTYACCLSESNISTLMWAHYADNLTGYIVEYDYNLTYEIIQQQNAAIYPILYSADKIDFSEVFVKLIDTYMENQSEGKDALIAEQQALIMSNQNLPQEAEFVNIMKDNDWGYESEWRILTTNIENLERIPIKVKPISIYLGSKMKTKDIQQLISISQTKGLSVYKMSTSVNGISFSKVD